jgi:hypothetical protein
MLEEGSELDLVKLELKFMRFRIMFFKLLNNS